MLCWAAPDNGNTGIRSVRARASLLERFTQFLCGLRNCTGWKRGGKKRRHPGGRRGISTGSAELRGRGLGRKFARPRSGTFGNLPETRYERVEPN